MRNSDGCLLFVLKTYCALTNILSKGYFFNLKKGVIYGNP